VLLDGEPTRSCLTFACQVNSTEIETVEGLADGDRLHPLQQAFLEHHGLQCGFCTPGFLLSAKALLAHNQSPTEVEIREELSGNVCRCTGYVGIVDAVRAASRQANKDSGHDRG
jgi:carbon-monoxide dehydrogenase small subunit